MKKTLFILGVLAPLAFSSCTKTFYDSFTKNKYDWKVFNAKTGTIEFEEGLTILQKDDDKNTFVTRNFGDKPFKGIECSINKLEGEIGVGIVWNFKDDDTHNRFIITTRDQQFFIQYRKDGVADTKMAWTTSEAVKKDSETNLLKIIQNGTYLEFYINDSLIHTEKDSKLQKNNIGVMIGSAPGSKCVVNYFKTLGFDKK